jgi:hypothetical protein
LRKLSSVGSSLFMSDRATFVTSRANADAYTFTQIDVPGTISGTEAIGINNAGQIVGAANGAGFIYNFGTVAGGRQVISPSTNSQ